MTEIGPSAFAGCGSLTRVVLPESVTSIGKGAFERCGSLTVTVPRGSYAEQYCRENEVNYTY